MQEKQSWRDILAEITQDPREKQRILATLNVKSITLSRWLSGETFPRANKLYQFLNLYPQYREQILSLLRDEKGMSEFTNPIEDDTPLNIPPEFYIELFKTRASVAENLYYWTLCNQILQNALTQLDPNRQGMSLWIARCMPPSGPSQQVRSLYESEGMGTPPWKENLEHDGMFLGAESLAGHVVTVFHYKVVNDLTAENTLVPVAYSEHEKSCAIFPILYAGRIAGVLSAASTQYNYFSAQNRLALIQKYADLVAMLFSPEEFYEPGQIALHIMPSQTAQRPFFAHFNDLTRQMIMEASSHNQPANKTEAEQQVRSQLEEQLLHYAIEHPFPGDG